MLESGGYLARLQAELERCKSEMGQIREAKREAQIYAEAALRLSSEQLAALPQELQLPNPASYNSEILRLQAEGDALRAMRDALNG
jgi:uncharacterized small protein (DUF1192 family)